MVESRRVLLVDDHDDARELLAELCQLFGHEVATAATGADAIDRGMDFRPVVAFIDIRLPDMDGFLVARTIRERLGAACPRLIALSGSVETRERALREGFDDYVTKPIDARQLQVLIIGA